MMVNVVVYEIVLGFLRTDSWLEALKAIPQRKIVKEGDSVAEVAETVEPVKE
jgi:hypothetical protein